MMAQRYFLHILNDSQADTKLVTYEIVSKTNPLEAFSFDDSIDDIDYDAE